MTKHKWHKEIKAWADGAEIEYDRGDGIWIKTAEPVWHIAQEYRIKPQPKKWAKEREAYDNGVAVQCKHVTTMDAWEDNKYYSDAIWYDSYYEFRITPQTKYLYVCVNKHGDFDFSLNKELIDTSKFHKLVGKIALEEEE